MAKKFLSFLEAKGRYPKLTMPRYRSDILKSLIAEAKLRKIGILQTKRGRG